MTKQETALRACAILEEYYPKSVCALQYKEPYELLIAVRLSAQCTDARVNIVTKTLFQQYPTLESFAAANLEELEQAVKPCGFYHMKAKSIKEMAIRLLTVYDGKIPEEIRIEFYAGVDKTVTGGVWQTLMERIDGFYRAALR